MVMDKTVVFKCFIQYIIGDIKGHNDLCGHKQRGCRTGQRLSDSYTSVDPDEFDPLTVQNVADTKGNAAKLNKLGLRPGLVNAFYSLPFADKLQHIIGSTPFDQLHVFLQGLYKYQAESFHNMIGEKDAEKKMRSVTTITSDQWPLISPVRVKGMLSSNTQFNFTGPTTPELLPRKCWEIT